MGPLVFLVFRFDLESVFCSIFIYVTLSLELYGGSCLLFRADTLEAVQSLKWEADFLAIVWESFISWH